RRRVQLERGGLGHLFDHARHPRPGGPARNEHPGRVRAMSARIRNQDGWAMVTAITLMFIMVSLGLASAALIDTQTQKSARERLDESSFNLAEGAVTAQSYLLTRAWPGGSQTAYPASCTQASVQANCPDPNLVKANYATA